MATQAQNLRHRYGITTQDIDHMMQAQRGRCPVCTKKLNNNYVVDHDHDTGQVRGLLHRGCNMMVGGVELYGDRIAEYLTRS